MRIGIDGRLIAETGIGRYIRNIAAGLARIDRKNEYFLYTTPAGAKNWSAPATNWTVRIADVHWHTVGEQLVLPRLFAADRLDLVHIPYVTIPILYAGPMVVTMHDLTLLSTETGKATTLPRPLYLAKRAALSCILSAGLRKASRVIAVSRSTETELLSQYPFLAGKTAVVYEGVDSALLGRPGKLKAHTGTPYFLYVGNAYPHKNLDLLVSAFGEFVSSRPDLPHELILVGRHDFFYGRLENCIPASVRPRVKFLHDVGDTGLAQLYRDAVALLFPSVKEGFGLPAIEAAAVGTPVVVSDIPVFHEILGGIPRFLPVSDRSAWTNAMVHLADNPPSHVPRKNLLTAYRWDEAAAGTLSVYEDSVRV